MTRRPHSIHSADALRAPITATQPDPRSTMFAFSEAASLEQHHKEIEAITLSVAVPEPVAIHFETARNLYLYAWFVYRFYMVAASHALATLEFGLRERLPKTLPEAYHRDTRRPPMLNGMLRYAIDQKMIRNEGFRRWHQAAEHRARERRADHVAGLTSQQEFDRLEQDESTSLEITAEDTSWDLVSLLPKSLTTQRNELAHGSSMLHRNVLGTFELIAEALNQLFPDPALPPHFEP